MFLSLTDFGISVEKDKSKFRKSEILELVGDNKKIKETLSWESKFSFVYTLNDTLDYWRNN